MSCVRFRSHLCPGGNLASLLLSLELEQPARFPFGYGVSATFTNQIITGLVMIRLR